MPESVNKIYDNYVPSQSIRFRNARNPLSFLNRGGNIHLDGLYHTAGVRRPRGIHILLRETGALWGPIVAQLLSGTRRRYSRRQATSSYYIRW